MKRLVRKVAAAMLGILCGLVLLELFLWALGAGWSPDRLARMEQRAADHGAITLLCLGDSFTHGFGARPGNGYPEQLQRLLDRRAGKGKYRVINAGTTAQSTLELLTMLDDSLALFQPDLVLLLTGGSNDWNFQGIFGQHGDGPLAWVGNALSRLRVPRVFRMLYRIATRPAQNKVRDVPGALEDLASQNLRTPTWRPTPRELREVTEARKAGGLPESIISYFELGDYYRNRKQFAEAARWYVRGTRENPILSHFVMLAHMAEGQNRLDQARSWIKQGARQANPLERVHQNHYMLFSATCIRLKVTDPCLHYLEQAARHHGHLMEVAEAMRDKVKLQDAGWTQLLVSWIRKDLEQIILRIRGRGLGLVLLDYPPTVAYAEQIHDLTRELAQKHKLPLVGNHQTFQRLLKEAPRERYFVEDGHCNDRGYGVMASSVYSTLRGTRAGSNAGR